MNGTSKQNGANEMTTEKTRYASADSVQVRDPKRIARQDNVTIRIAKDAFGDKTVDLVVYDQEVTIVLTAEQARELAGALWNTLS